MKCIQLVRDEGAVDAIHVATINVEAFGQSMINSAMTIDTCNSKWQSYCICSNITQQISEKSGLWDVMLYGWVYGSHISEDYISFIFKGKLAQKTA